MSNSIVAHCTYFLMISFSGLSARQVRKHVLLEAEGFDRLSEGSVDEVRIRPKEITEGVVQRFLKSRFGGSVCRLLDRSRDLASSPISSARYRASSACLLYARSSIAGCSRRPLESTSASQIEFRRTLLSEDVISVEIDLKPALFSGIA